VAPAAPQIDDESALTRSLLAGVSRTFALTIPELPPALYAPVANGYLLCRLADTIEDEPGLTPDERRAHHAALAAAVAGSGDAAAFAAALLPRLTAATLPAEHELVRQAARVIAVTLRLAPDARAALAHCLAVMCSGMDRFQQGTRGLPDLCALDRYCYVVAGVVGEMLTELFCASSPAIGARRAALLPRAVSFGQGLQMTNILKDVWEDLARGSCWLPRDVFARHGFDLDALRPGQDAPAFRAGLGELLGIAHGHLRRALEYVLLVPQEAGGVRRFCLRALGMAVLTLRRIDARRGFASAAEVKISHAAVRAVVAAGDRACGHDRLLELLFGAAATGLPAPILAHAARP
jgi:farnesyl-diphosphate farnesyltransferase